MACNRTLELLILTKTIDHEGHQVEMFSIFSLNSLSSHPWATSLPLLPPLKHLYLIYHPNCAHSQHLYRCRAKSPPGRMPSSLFPEEHKFLAPRKGSDGCDELRHDRRWIHRPIVDVCSTFT